MPAAKKPARKTAARKPAAKPGGRVPAKPSTPARSKTVAKKTPVKKAQGKPAAKPQSKVKPKARATQQVAPKPAKKAARKPSAPTRPKAPAAKAPKPAAVTKGKTPATKKPSKKVPSRKAPGRSAATGKAGFQPYREKRGESYMGPGQSEHFRKLLLQWRQELMEEVDRTVHHMQDDASNFPDPNDRATQEEEFALELRTRDRERKLIKKINEALVKLDSGDYGFCEVCGVEIGVRRLEARPTATLCIDCKTLDEIREKQML